MLHAEDVCIRSTYHSIWHLRAIQHTYVQWLKTFTMRTQESSLEVSGTNIPEKKEKLEGKKKSCFRNICWTETWELQESKSLEYQNNNKKE